MTATKSIIQNSLTRTRIKFTATAGSDTITVNLKKAISLTSTGNITFVAGDNGTGKIVRASGSWATNFTSAPGNKFVTITSSVSNNSTFSVLSVASTNAPNDTIVVMEAVADEAAVAATATAYESDVAIPGQTIGTPLVNICGFEYSFGTSCTVVRNSVTILNLFGTWWGGGEHTRGVGLAEQNGSDIVITTVTSGGTLVLDLSKVSGFNAAYQMRDVR